MSTITEFRYETMLSMAMYVRTGAWRTVHNEDYEISQERIISIFQRAFSLVIAKESRGNRGFNPNGGFFAYISMREEENGIDYYVYDKGALECIVEGLWGSRFQRKLCFNMQGKGLRVEYFRYMTTPSDGFVTVESLLSGDVLGTPNARRFYKMLAAHPFIYMAHLADKDGCGLLDYDKETREQTKKDAEKLG